MDKQKVVEALNGALEMEIATAVKYLYFSFLVFGPQRPSLVGFFRKEVQEALEHATMLGEKITALGGRPRLDLTLDHAAEGLTLDGMLRESLAHEEHAVAIYADILKLVKDDTALRTLFEDQLLQEQEHVEEVRKVIG